MEGWLADVDAWLARTPGFLAGKPLVVDVSGLPLGKDELRTLLSELKARSVVILGVEGAEPAWLGDGYPPLLTGGRSAGMVELPDRVRRPESRPIRPRLRPDGVSPGVAHAGRGIPQSPSTLLIETSVRSGQAIVDPDGDVTVIGSVASGAEIVAGGSIHIYGTLRGRALAGMYGKAGRASSAAGSRPSSSPSTGSTRLPTSSSRICKRRRSRPGSKAGLWTSTSMTY